MVAAVTAATQNRLPSVAMENSRLSTRAKAPYEIRIAFRMARRVDALIMGCIPNIRRPDPPLSGCASGGADPEPTSSTIPMTIRNMPKAIMASCRIISRSCRLRGRRYPAMTYRIALSCRREQFDPTCCYFSWESSYKNHAASVRACPQRTCLNGTWKTKAPPSSSQRYRCQKLCPISIVRTRLVVGTTPWAPALALLVCINPA
jgi:hypothetical protein